MLWEQFNINNPNTVINVLGFTHLINLRLEFCLLFSDVCLFG